MDEFVRDRWPVLAVQVETALRAAGELLLADRWQQARVVQRCRCGDQFCQSFYTEPPPTGPYGPGHRTVELAASWPGYLNLDVVGDTIVNVEVLYRPPLS